MKKRIGDLTLREITNICKNHIARAFWCEGCPFYNDYRCMAKVDLESLDKIDFEYFESKLDQEIEVDREWEF